MVRLLYRRDHSVKELQDKLKPYYEQEAIDRALEKADSQKYLKEPADLSVQVMRSMHRRQRGHLKIAHELQKKGLPALEPDREMELEKARQLLEKLIQKDIDDIPSDERMKLKQKAFRFLQNRGFDFETIRQSVDEKF